MLEKQSRSTVQSACETRMTDEIPNGTERLAAEISGISDFEAPVRWLSGLDAYTAALIVWPLRPQIMSPKARDIC